MPAPIPPDILPRLARLRADLAALRLDQVVYGFSKLPKSLLDHPEVLALKGLFECRGNRFASGIQILRRAHALAPDSEQIACDLAEMLWHADRFDEAVHLLAAYIESHAEQLEPVRLICDYLYRSGHVPVAYAYAERLLARAPDDVSSLFIAAYRNVDLRKFDASLDCYARAAAVLPADRRSVQGRVFAMLYAGSDPLLIRQTTEAWCARAHADIPRLPPPSPRPRTARRLRVGYVAGEFRNHVVHSFFGPLLEFHDRARVEITCYSNNPTNDDHTLWCRSKADRWRDIRSTPDAAVAQQIRADEIDVLVDLSGHTDSNRLEVFARRPAPVQATYLGYPATTGLPEIDYRITDALADSPGLTESFHTETLYRLPRCAWAFSPLVLADFDPTEPPPSLRDPQSGFTFGSFNLLTKVNQASTHLWARALAATDGRARLLMTDRRGLLNDPEGVHLLQQEFAAGGADLDKVALASWVPDAAAQRHRLRQVDCMLDPLSYNGTTTTCEALWHGVPTLTLPGPAHVSRVGLSLLTAAGLPDFIATDEPDFIAKAAALARDPAPLAEIRSTLRQRLAASPLADHKSLATALEDAYFDMARQKSLL